MKNTIMINLVKQAKKVLFRVGEHAPRVQITKKEAYRMLETPYSKRLEFESAHTQPYSQTGNLLFTIQNDIVRYGF